MGRKNQEVVWKYNAITKQTPNEEREIIDLVRTSFIPNCHIRKISQNEYITGKTAPNGDFYSDGVVYEFARKENAMRNRRSLRQIFRSLRQLIASNFAGGESELFLTLTYADQHHDPQIIKTDLELFWKKLKYRNNNLKYIAIIEPHETGEFHVHMLLADTTGQKLYIPHDELEKIWGNGFVKAERLEDIDHMGAYFIAYFTNAELTEEEAEKYGDDVTEKNGKKYIKGKRLDYYPEYMQIYRYSRNCNKPVKYTGIEIDDQLRDTKKVFEHETRFENEGKEYIIKQEQYKK